VSALSTQTASSLEHVAAFRAGERSLWLAEFDDITAQDFTVTLAGVDQAELYRRFRAGVGLRAVTPEEARRERAPERTSEPVRSPEAARSHETVRPRAPVSEAATPRGAGVEPPAFCRSCGGGLRPGAAFCPGCGHPVAGRS